MFALKKLLSACLQALSLAACDHDVRAGPSVPHQEAANRQGHARRGSGFPGAALDRTSGRGSGSAAGKPPIPRYWPRLRQRVQPFPTARQRRAGWWCWGAGTATTAPWHQSISYPHPRWSVWPKGSACNGFCRNRSWSCQEAATELKTARPSVGSGWYQLGRPDGFAWSSNPSPATPSTKCGRCALSWARNARTGHIGHAHASRHGHVQAGRHEPPSRPRPSTWSATRHAACTLCWA